MYKGEGQRAESGGQRAEGKSEGQGELNRKPVSGSQ